jgi:hypothetical protein
MKGASLSMCSPSDSAALSAVVPCCQSSHGDRLTCSESRKDEEAKVSDLDVPPNVRYWG